MVKKNVLTQLGVSEEQLLEYLDKDVREIFSMMLGIELVPAKPSMTVRKFRNCVTAMVGFTGSYSGMASINIPENMALEFASIMLGMELTECDADVKDSLGEIANMISGSFKHHFVSDGHEVRLSTPSVISGEEYFMNFGSVSDTATIMFEHNEGHFMVNIYLEA